MRLTYIDGLHGSHGPVGLAEPVMTEEEYLDTLRRQMDKAANTGDTRTLAFLHTLWRIHVESRADLERLMEDLRNSP